jgi:hypothetical protein
MRTLRSMADDSFGFYTSSEAERTPFCRLNQDRKMGVKKMKLPHELPFGKLSIQ